VWTEFILLKLQTSGRLLRMWERTFQFC
jgi:hypothetical protein